jgi:Flp pilus assembly protein TadD
MKSRRLLFGLSCSGTVLVSALLAGCNSRDARASQALTNYETAMASGNLVAARDALVAAVAARDDVAEYWEDLGQVQLQLGSLSDANYAFTRAQELDRDNPQVLAALSQLSLAGGNLELAQRYEHELEQVAPHDPSVRLVSGYLLLTRRQLDEADKDVDQLLEMAPLDPGAKLLKARILVARGNLDGAIALLEQQALAKPNDAGSLKALLILLQRNDDWPKIAPVAARLATLQPGNQTAAVTAIKAAFKANDIALARHLSETRLGPEAPPALVNSILLLWAQYWHDPAAVQEATALARSVPPQQRLAYATYFNSVGQARLAAVLAGGAPQLPVTLANSSSNAIYAEALAVGGHGTDAARLLNSILAEEPDHVYALRARTRLELKSGDGVSAVRDAQRLITIEPNSPDHRLLLAQAYVAAGDRRSADRTLWDAFHDIPGDEDLYHALRTQMIARTGDGAARQVDDEYQQQREQQLEREFI